MHGPIGVLVFRHGRERKVVVDGNRKRFRIAVVVSLCVFGPVLEQPLDIFLAGRCLKRSGIRTGIERSRTTVGDSLASHRSVQPV